MKSVKWFLLLVALIVGGFLLTACSQSDPNSATPGSSSAPSGVSNPSSTSTPIVAENVQLRPYQGAVDFRNCEAVGGWVVAKNSQAETRVEFYIDDKLIDTAPATKLRPDLTSWGTGRHGFSFKMPAAYKDGKPHRVKIKVVGTDFEVPFYQAHPAFTCNA